MPSTDEAVPSLVEHPITHLTTDYASFQTPAVRGPSRSSGSTWAIRCAIVRARSALMNMRLADASSATARLTRLLSVRNEPYLVRYARTLRILRASILAAEDDFPAAREALGDVTVYTGDALAAAVLRYLDWRLADTEAGAPDTVDYLATPVGGKAVCRILSLCVSSGLAFDRLQLAVSADLATEALQLARLRYGNNSPMSTFPATLLAQVAYEQGRLEEAEALVKPRLSVIRDSGILECVARASVLLARLALHRGRYRAALAILRETEALGRARNWPRLVSVASLEYARALELPRCVDALGSGARLPKQGAAVVLLERRRQTQLVGRPWHGTAEARMPVRMYRAAPGTVPGTPLSEDAVCFSAVEAALARVCSAASNGRSDDSYELLIPWLRIGAARGLRMVFLDAGRPLLAVLRRLYYALPTNDPRLSDLRPYLATLLRSGTNSHSEAPSSVSCRPLSHRETGILQMIAHGMSNKRIAQSLGITPETVKSHAKSIFVKLASRTRAQAVARAEVNGFL